jgi:hypothetical protein
MGMGQFIERAAAAWKKQAFEELHAINLRMKNIYMMTESAGSIKAGCTSHHCCYPNH